jgi:aspartate/methionine/tyrosine aminotransferase
MQQLLSVHHALDAECRERNGRLFVSDWYCSHQFGRQITSGLDQGPGDDELLSYYFQNDDTDIHELILRFHALHSEINEGPDSIFVSAGLSPLITAQMMMLKRRGVRDIYYLRPLYYTYYFLAESLGLRLIPVNDNPSVLGNTALALPRESNCWLILCDPVWYLGRNLDAPVIAEITRWQVETGGMVVVDGAFQYQRWDGNDQPERTSEFIVDQTIRNLCPTKAVAVHGPRFAYAIVPPGMREELRYCYSNTAGSGSVFDRGASVSIMKWLNTQDSNQPLLDLVANRYRQLIDLGIMRDAVGAQASYFCFVSTPVEDRHLITMNQDFFDTTCFPDFYRFNLLLPDAEFTQFINLACSYIGVDPAEAVKLILGQ